MPGEIKLVRISGEFDLTEFKLTDGKWLEN